MDSIYDVVIIGGGATGAGVARDCAMRGLKTLLVERNDIANGATGRNHGLLHSGARYAVKDPESAIGCFQENKILREIAPDCVDMTQGLFITLPGEDISYQSKFIEACKVAGIDAVAIDPELARRMEPSVNPALIGAVKVPDGSVDPFRLTLLNILDARAKGVEVLTYHEVNGFIREQDRVTGVRVLDKKSNQQKEFRCNMVVNAAGIWGYGISIYAEINPIEMYASKGTLLVMGHRINNVVLNRCHDAADADILVPCDTVSIIGTTSIEVPYSEVDRLSTTPEEVDFLIKEGSKLAPSIAHTRIIRAYAGVRPLFSNGAGGGSGRSISRGIVLLDHSTRDGLQGLITITGGKLITYRLMAEQVTDLVCERLGIIAKCRTAEVPLYSPETRSENRGKSIGVLSPIRRESLTHRYGRALKDMVIEDLVENDELVCECEGVSVGEIKQSIREFKVEKLADLRRRTRIGMGTCQGAMCGCRAARLIADHKEGCCYNMREDLVSFINERWAGMQPIAWGDTLREGEYMKWLYRGV